MIKIGAHLRKLSQN